ncbi:hypothetical protein EVAR_86752_1 [Eumeta japonica]|uniref:Ig-like domain-containing protein n=1 Tax=Eumeta variegata TaxID=151549 RepID=A0A4C1W216_EUMVA|nr:hypothetical protein EVAR_86752_1 [Eumeta japonica]
MASTLSLTCRPERDDVSSDVLSGDGVCCPDLRSHENVRERGHESAGFVSLRCAGRSGALGLEPDFLYPLENVTIAQGRDATFTCVVNNLGGYRVSGDSATARVCIQLMTIRSRLEAPPQHFAPTTLSSF